MAKELRFYCGVNEDRWNYHPVSPGKYACISPVMGSSTKTRQENRIWVPPETKVMQDSGAFCDSLSNRLSFKDVLERQIYHARKFEYADQVTHMASYDLLIDEKWKDGIRYKQRWSEGEAWSAVRETIAAARYILEWRNEYQQDVNLVLSAQGVSLDQYLSCADAVLDRPGRRENDALGLGGWCIMGIRKRLLLPFKEIMRELVPMAASKGVKHIHIWGVLYAPAIGNLLWLCDQHDILLSTDSAGPQKRPAMGTWGYMGWTDKDYRRPPVETRGQERERHVIAVREWLKNFRETEWYKGCG